jgi:hypothetical protein
VCFPQNIKNCLPDRQQKEKKELETPSDWTVPRFFSSNNKNLSNRQFLMTASSSDSMTVVQRPLPGVHGVVGRQRTRLLLRPKRRQRL